MNETFTLGFRYGRCRCFCLDKNMWIPKGLMEKILSLSLEESNFTTPPLESGTKPEVCGFRLPILPVPVVFTVDEPWVG